MPVAPLLQCTDSAVFKPDPDEAVPSHPLLFVGNYHKQCRALVRDVIDARLPIAIYGRRWEGVIPKEFVHGEHIPNNLVRKFYSRCGILLNDHWPNLREKGFLSNQLFDAVACAAVVVSDDIAGMCEVFDDGITVYDGTAGDLVAKVAQIQAQPEQYRQRARRARARVLKAHTFTQRAAEILRAVQSFHEERTFGAETPSGADAQCLPPP